MEHLDNLNTKEDVRNAYDRATRNMSAQDIIAIESAPMEKKGDSPLVAHAKACYRKLASFEGASWSADGFLEHRV